MDDIRALEIRIAKAFGYTVKQATLYAPSGTLLGGVYAVHSGSIPDSPGWTEHVWETYTPHFAAGMDNAEWLLNQLYERYGLEYNLFRDNGQHTCEIGAWSKEPGEKDTVWMACENTMALAVVKAVEKCEWIMPAVTPSL